MKTFALEILTPDKVHYKDQVEMVVVPGADGSMGILANHVPLAGRLQPGRIEVSRDDQTLFFSCGPGLIEVGKGEVSILADSIEPVP